MKLGVFLFATDETMAPADFAVAAEERGFESVWFPEHTHVPACRTTPFPGGGALPPEYFRSVDPFLALAAASSVTSSVRLGTSVSLLAQRDTIHFAKQAATLDHLSAGRLEVGVGYGWNVEEMAAHGVRFEDRRGIVRERVAAARRLWTDEIARFDGRYVDLAPSFMWPKPVQRPGPPVLLGGSGGPRLVRAAAEFADGLITLGPGVADTVRQLRQELDARGRRADAVPVTAWGHRHDPAVLEHLQHAGVDRAVLVMPPGERDEVLVALDRSALQLLR